MAYNRHMGYKYSHFGEDTKGHDVKAFGDTTGKYVFWDASADTLYVAGTLSLDGAFSAGDIALIDAETLSFGTGSDVVMQWDGTNFIVSAAADDSLIEIGDSAVTQLSFDLKWYANEASGASYLYADASANLLYTVGVDLQFKDNDYLVFGTGAGASGDVSMVWNATDFAIASVAASSLFYIGGSANVFNMRHYGDVNGYNNEADATGYTITAKKSRGAGDTALADNDVVFQVAAIGLNDNATPAAKTIANIKALMTDVSDTTEDGAWIFETMVAGAAAAEKLRIADVVTASAGVVVGVDGTGYDVQLFGDTSGCSMLWDQSEDQLVITGPADVPGLKLAGAGTFSPAAFATAGTAWADGGTPAFAADQKYLIIDYGGTLYRLPVWANA